MINFFFSFCYCSTVSLDCKILECTTHTKYLGFTFSMNVQDNDDMLRQLRRLYIYTG